MFHRCISQDEARLLAEGAKDSAKGDKDRSALAKKAEDKKSASKEEKPKALPKGYDLVVGPIAADEGELTVGRLHLPMDRYRACIDQNGGLKKPSGNIVVKFLVRAERVRAEGVIVDSFDSVSKAAAECVASVVDRRQVGVPTVPLTAAKLTFQLKEKP
jgi:hypothetical protein